MGLDGLGSDKLELRANRFPWFGASPVGLVFLIFWFFGFFCVLFCSGPVLLARLGKDGEGEKDEVIVGR